MPETKANRPKQNESKTWIGVLAFFIVIALVAPTLIYFSFFDVKTPGDEKQQRGYSTRGIVEEIEEGSRRIVIAHEEIPNVMPAMTMPFVVMTADSLENVHEGDEVELRFVMRDRAAYIQELRVVAHHHADEDEPAAKSN